MLRDTVHPRDSSNYIMYTVKKRSGGRRVIHSVSKDLFTVHQFINQEILQRCVPHASSFAFHSSGGIRKCAAMHCGARWLFQFDLIDFFYDITEIDVYRVFQELGYRNLLAFELARLCTTTHLPRRYDRLLFHDTDRHDHEEDSRIGADDELSVDMPIVPYPSQPGVVGVLPQGAPTSPMLSNLVARKLDDLLHSFALEQGFVYTRYADDITFSASFLPKQQTIGKIHRRVVHLLGRAGLEKTARKHAWQGRGRER